MCPTAESKKQWNRQKLDNKEPATLSHVIPLHDFPFCVIKVFFFPVPLLPLWIVIGLCSLRFLTEILFSFLLSISLFSTLPSDSFISVVRFGHNMKSNPLPTIQQVSMFDAVSPHVQLHLRRSGGTAADSKCHRLSCPRVCAVLQVYLASILQKLQRLSLTYWLQIELCAGTSRGIKSSYLM